MPAVSWDDSPGIVKPSQSFGLPEKSVSSGKGTKVPEFAKTWYRDVMTDSQPLTTLDTKQLGRELGLSYTTLLGDIDPASGEQVADMPVAMEAPADRPISSAKWAKMGQDSLRPEPAVVAMGQRLQHRGWVRKAFGRPPLQNWTQQVWLYLEDDRLCWIKEQDLSAAATGGGVESRRASPTAGTRRAAATLGRVTLYPSAGDVLNGDGGARAAGLADALQSAPEAASTGAPADVIHYVPLDRVPVRSTPRGYVPAPAVAAVADSQAIPRERLGTAFAVTAGSHTHLFAAATRADATAWVDAIRSEWLHCAMHSQRSMRTDRGELEALRVREQAAGASAARLQEAHHTVVGRLERSLAEQTAAARAAQEHSARLLQQLSRAAHYEVRTVTGARVGAGTDSGVFLELLGERDGRCSGAVALARGAGRPVPFARGAVDHFTVSCADLAGVAAVRIWHDASGTRPHWFLESVHVRLQRGAGEAPGPWADFPARCWLSAVHGPKRLMVRLEPAKPTGLPVKYDSALFDQEGDLAPVCSRRACGCRRPREASMVAWLHGTAHDPGVTLQASCARLEHGLAAEWGVSRTSTV